MKLNTRNQELWLQGLYIYSGVGAILSDPKEKRKYPEKPFEIFSVNGESEEAKKEKALNNAIRQLDAFKDSWDRKHGRQHDN